jgi:AraC-like DNA-binding protein
MHDVARHVRQLVNVLIASGGGSLDIRTVAASLGTSVRTLQRRLEEMGLTYAGIMQQVRCASARKLLRNDRRTIGEIAHRLGYSDHAHFTRAFQRWTGSTPRDFRRGRHDPMGR